MDLHLVCAARSARTRQAAGRDEFNSRLEEGFAKGYVDLGNEPNLQAPFLFNYSGKPWLTQKYSRLVLRDYFELSPYTGWMGEEDEGQMSAYFVLLSMGLFEMEGGCAVRPYYDLSSPLFDRVVLHLDPAYYPGGTFTIEARGNSADQYLHPIRHAQRPSVERGPPVSRRRGQRRSSGPADGSNTK